MIISDGSPSSLTPAPTALVETDPDTGSKKRFSVRGNAIVTGGAGTLGLYGCEMLLELGLEGLMILDINPEGSGKEIKAMRAKFLAAKIMVQQVDATDEEAVAVAVAVMKPLAYWALSMPSYTLLAW